MYAPEDIFNLLAGDEYVPVPNYRDLTPEEEINFRDRGLNRVTDVCIPESVMIDLENIMLGLWRSAMENEESLLPYEYVYRAIDSIMSSIPCERLEQNVKNSWVVAAWEHRGDGTKAMRHIEPLEFENVKLTQRSYK